VGWACSSLLISDFPFFCLKDTKKHYPLTLTTHRGRVYAGWGFSQQYYREELYKKVLGFKDLEDFMVNFWEAWALSKGKSIGPRFPCSSVEKERER
jgi:hypothetical protein